MKNVLSFAEQVTSAGFAVVPDVFTRVEMDRLATELEGTPLQRSRAGIRHLMNQSAIRELAFDSRLLSNAREIIGESAFPFHATLFAKSTEANWLVAWHQDTALPLRERRDVSGWGPWSIKSGVEYAHAPAKALEQVLAIRVHIDDSTTQNGSLRVVPNTHARGVLTDEQIHQLSTEIEPVECTVGKGGLVLMRPLIVHASSKASSAQSRRVVHIEYAAQRLFDGLDLAIA